MAITNNNVGNVKFLRNGGLYGTHDAAYEALTSFTLTEEQDGTIILARYGSGNNVKTLAGLVYADQTYKTITIVDVEGASGEVEKLRQEINAKLGNGIGSGASETVTAQLTALSGNGQSTSAETSVEGAKRYADGLIETLDYTDTAETGSYVSEVNQVDGKISVTRVALPSVNTISESGKAITAVSESNGEISASAGNINAQYVDVTGFTATNVQGALEEVKDNIGEAISGLDVSDEAVAGEYVSQVSETDGKISVTRAALPSVTGQSEAKKFVIAVSEDKGTVSDTKGSITSSGKTIVLTDNTDGGVNFEANVDGTTIIVDEQTGVMSVASSALVQYEGDNDTIQISTVSEGVRTVSSPLTIQKVTTGLSEEVKEEYRLVGASGNTIGAPVQIYKDSHIVSITYITDPSDEHYQNLEYVYVNASGVTSTTYVDMSELVIEAEFASGVTVTDGVAHGVVDPTSETFLTVGADGFKLSGVQDAINSAVNGLDADVSGNSTHVTVGVVEENGVITGVTVSESNIANADDLAELSAKTVTNVTSTNSSIDISTANTSDGTVEIDVITDADKIKMSGFSAENTTALSGIAESDTIATAFEKTNAVITENERVTAEALTDFDTRLDTISGDVDTIKSQYVSGVSVNGNAVTVANHVAPISISAATSATTASTASAIVVDTNTTTGAITLGLNYIDCGTY
jgi:hypothetical protein